MKEWELEEGTLLEKYLWNIEVAEYVADEDNGSECYNIDVVY